MKLEMSFATWL